MTLYRIKRMIKFWWQRRTRGWDDSDTWSLDMSIAEFIVPRLKRFKELKNGIPCSMDFDENVPFEENEKKWDEMIDKMIRAFELSLENDHCFLDDKQKKEFDEGFELF